MKKKSNEPTKTKSKMKKTIRFLSMAALAMVGLVMTGCSSEDNFADIQQPENKSNVVTMTTTVGFDEGVATTRALTSGGVKTFAAGDQIAVIYKDTRDSTVTATSEALTAGDITNGGKNANFTVTLTNPKAGEAVRYVYPAAMLATTVATNAAVNADANVKYAALATQDGTLTTLASKLDLAIFDGSLTSGAALPASASMTNQFAILAVTLKDNAATPAEITASITGMTIGDGTNTYTVSRSAAAGPIYVAIRPTSGADIYAMATADATKTNYSKSLTGKTYAANNGYNVSWKMTNEGTVSLATPLTMKAITAGTIVVKNPKDGMKYSTDGGTTKTTMTMETTIDVIAGDVVTFYGSSTGYNKDEITGGTAYVKAYGNIMSLFYESTFAENSKLPGTSGQHLLGFFRNNSKLIDASGLLLPATTLQTSCYNSMFAGCTALTGAPVLPAETLANSCYYTMFSGCYSLASVTCLATNIIATSCTHNWLFNAGRDVLTTKTFTKASGMNSWTTGHSGIPSGWTVK